MIKSFGDKNTEKMWNGEIIKRIPLEIQSAARRKLRMLNNSQSLLDLKIPPSNMLEKLKGKRKEYYSIRVNIQYRIIFKWTENNTEKVTFTDYH